MARKVLSRLDLHQQAALSSASGAPNLQVLCFQRLATNVLAQNPVIPTV